jgi:hypothetical protein
MNDDVTKYCAELCEVETLARDYWIDREYSEQDNAEPATDGRMVKLRKRASALEQEHQLLALLARAFLTSEGTPDPQYGSLHGFRLRRLLHFLDGGTAVWEWDYVDRFEAALASLRAEAAVAAELQSGTVKMAGQTPAGSDPPVLPEVNLELNQVRFGGQCRDLTADGALLLSKIVTAYPHHFSASSICSKPSEVKDSFPKLVLDHIKSEPGKGYRWVP